MKICLADLTERTINNFWSRVKTGNIDECWLWLGPTIKGRGVLSIGSRITGNKRVVYAARLAWVIHNGEIPNDDGFHGTLVLHECDMPLCVNVRHLFLGTVQDNHADMVRKDRHHKPTRENHGMTKLSFDDLKKIRKLYRTGKYTQLYIARKYGVSQSHISRITLK